MMLNAIRVRNFKAVGDSGLLKLGPLTAFIGNNGVGKSSLIVRRTIKDCSRTAAAITFGKAC